ncbi:hypothetical protein HY626_02150 [Candidatus Uhrbacteria bacterium]|nr:hypothetical protein [Candidatus Uhrbacteria bacterium]
MESVFVPLFGRLLIMSLALSGICLNMLFGAAVAQAMDSEMSLMYVDDFIAHEMVVMHSPTDEPQPKCCTSIRMQHNTDATVPNQNAPFVSFTTDLPIAMSTRPIQYTKQETASSDHHPPHRPFSLTGTTIKRE